MKFTRQARRRRLQRENTNARHNGTVVTPSSVYIVSPLARVLARLQKARAWLAATHTKVVRVVRMAPVFESMKAIHVGGWSDVVRVKSFAARHVCLAENARKTLRPSLVLGLTLGRTSRHTTAFIRILSPLPDTGRRDPSPTVLLFPCSRLLRSEMEQTTIYQHKLLSKSYFKAHQSAPSTRRVITRYTHHTFGRKCARTVDGRSTPGCSRRPQRGRQTVRASGWS